MVDPGDLEDGEFRYDPDRDPDPERWLELDDEEKVQLVAAQHWAARERAPNLRAHALFHVIVENQIALRVPPVVATMARLEREGLLRHDALHAVGSVLSEFMFELVQPGAAGTRAASEPRYAGLLARLNAAQWRAS